MKQISSLRELAAYAAGVRAAGKPVALVPTLGALHPGKQALIRAAAESGAEPVVSLYLNPLQFSPNEPIARYPREPEADLRQCEECGAGAAFTLAEGEMLPKGFSSVAQEEALSRTLCGPSRPGHFRGFTTMLAKLLNVVQPARVYFGQKTAQRAAVARKFMQDLGYGAAVTVVPTVREADGLAHGTANRLMTDLQRRESLALITALRRAQEMTAAGTRSPDRLVAEATHHLGQHRRIRTIYVSIVSPDTLDPQKEVTPGHSLLAIAVWVDEIRLIDNILL